MPELAEVKIMSDFINAVAREEGFFDVVEKSPVSKVKTEMDPFQGCVFSLKASARGKELLLKLDMMGLEEKNLLCGMGMS